MLTLTHTPLAAALTLALGLALPVPLMALQELQEQELQAEAPPAQVGFGEAAATLGSQLQASLAELSALRERIAAETVPLGRRLRELESELIALRAEQQQTARLLDTRSLDLSNLNTEIAARQDEATYLSNLLAEFVRNLEAGLHVAELQRYRDELIAARLAPENTNLDPAGIFSVQASVVELSLARLEDALGGTRFEGTVVDGEGMVREGEFVLVGPVAVFRSADGSETGTAEQRLGSLEPVLVPFSDPEHARAAGEMLATGKGRLPLDTTLGNAHLIETTEETIWEHIRKGGPVMVPILLLALAALSVALYKWFSLARLPQPDEAQVEALLEAVEREDSATALARARAIDGPLGRMLQTGVEHLHEPRELIEEVLYETVLTTKLRLQRMLPFVAIAAASAPLLGLLGTVTGIINTFKLITIFGSGDVRTLSGGISEALITTEFGLIVAIPSLLLHSFLSRKASGMVSRMETTAMSFLNRIRRTPAPPAPPVPIPHAPGQPPRATPPLHLAPSSLS